MTDTNTAPAQTTRGSRLKGRRVTLRLSAEDVARRAHVGATTLSGLENDKGWEGLGVGSLLRICAVLECSPNYLLGGWG